jgi:hypothetical protein
VRLFQLRHPSIEYSSDPDARVIGEILVATCGEVHSRSLTLSLCFGGTEISAKARGPDGEPVDCTLRLESHDVKFLGLPNRDVITADICFVMDCTGSMGVWIEAAREQLISIANRVQVWE